MFLVRIIVGVLRAIASLARRGPSISLQLFDETGREIQEMESLAVDKKRVLTLRVLDSKKRPGAKIDGVPTWTSSVPGNNGPLALFPSPDGMSCEVAWNAPGTATLTIEADADLGAGVTKITKSVDFQCGDLVAAELEVTVGPEVDL